MTSITKYALYYKGGRRGRWVLHDTFDSEAAAWDRVRELPFRQLSYWVSPVLVNDADTETTPAELKNYKTRTAAPPS